MKRLFRTGLIALVLMNLGLPLTRITLVRATEVQKIAQNQNQNQNRNSLAIMDFDFASTGFTGEQFRFDNVFGGGGPAKGMSDLITNKLVQDGSYSVIERSKIDKVLQEQNLGQSGRVDPSTAAQVGRLLGVDAVIIGTITRFNLEEHESGGGIGFLGIGGSKKKQKAIVQLTARLVSTTTGEIMAVAQGEGKSSHSGGSVSILGIGGGSNADKTDTLLSNAADQAVSGMVSEIVAAAPKLAALPDILPMVNATVADVTGDLITLNKGSKDGFKSGMILSVEQVIKEVKDPETGAVIRKITKNIGKIKLTDVDNSSSLGTIMAGSAKIQIGDVAKAVNDN